jgi:hypothetical protein
MKILSTWEPLRPGPFGIHPGMPGIDPMWIWADATRYRDQGRPDPKKGLWFVIDRRRGRPFSRFVSMSMKPGQWKGHQQSGWRVELAMPVIPERPMPHSPARRSGAPLSAETAVRRLPGKAELLIGIIDSGCPFASHMIRDAEGSDTRVLALWDQDDDPAFARVGGRPPKGLGYGRAIYRDGLNGLMDSSTSPSSSVDEALCYRLAGYDVTRHEMTHGAAVMSQLFVGPIRTAAIATRSQKTRNPAQDGPADIDDASLVFVQLPRAAVQDCTSAALPRHVVDGLRFILDCARGCGAERVVVNISNGTSRTAHDGTSILERAIAAWVEEARGLGIEASVVLPAGNTNEEQRHAQLVDFSQHLELQLPPGCETPQYVTVRWPMAAAAQGMALRVTPPGGTACTIKRGEAFAWPSATAPQCGVVSPLPARTEAARTLIALAPTASYDADRVVAASGIWKLELVSDGTAQSLDDDPVQFWISRNQRNPGAEPRCEQAYFVDWDESHNPGRYLRPRLEDPPGAHKNGIRRDGALSGMATVSGRKLGARKTVVIVGSCVGDPAHGTRSRYSATGPAAGPRKRGRALPDMLALGDDHAGLAGLAARGTLSGTVVRVIGTSFSAPLVARAIANRTFDHSIARRGRGRALCVGQSRGGR